MNDVEIAEQKPPKIDIKLLRGFKDIMPEDEAYWQRVVKVVLKTARDYDFGFINTPALEEVGLFERTSGESSDIVSKELFRFRLPKGDDKEGEGMNVALRPEGTAPVIRAYIEHGMLNRPQPLKFWYLMPMFRYDKPQAGRYRQHFQWGFEVIGEAGPVVDAQVIIAMYNVYKKLGLDVVIAINSIGNKESRASYIEALREYFEPLNRKLCNYCRKRLKANPLRILDCKDESCQVLVEDAPQIVDFLDEESRMHFIAVLEFLDELDIPYALQPRLVRGLDYYNRTTFEIFLRNEYESGKKLNAVGGGGRYDGLSEQLGGRSTPAVGASAGVERVILAMKEHKIAVPVVKKYDVFIAQLGSDARRKALSLFEKLKDADWSVGESFSKDGLSAQLERANKVGAQFTLILGQKEILEGTVIVRDMSSGIQEEVVFEKIIEELHKRVKKVTVVKNENPAKFENQESFVQGTKVAKQADNQTDNQEEGSENLGKEVAEGK